LAIAIRRQRGRRTRIGQGQRFAAEPDVDLTVVFVGVGGWIFLPVERGTMISIEVTGRLESPLGIADSQDAEGCSLRIHGGPSRPRVISPPQFPFLSSDHEFQPSRDERFASDTEVIVVFPDDGKFEVINQSGRARRRAESKGCHQRSRVDAGIATGHAVDIDPNTGPARIPTTQRITQIEKSSPTGGKSGAVVAIERDVPISSHEGGDAFAARAVRVTDCSSVGIVPTEFIHTGSGGQPVDDTGVFPVESDGGRDVFAACGRRATRGWSVECRS